MGAVQKYSKLFLDLIMLIINYKLKKISFEDFSQGLNDIGESLKR